jgi:cytochrome c-type biogenesis protein CcmH
MSRRILGTLAATLALGVVPASPLAATCPRTSLAEIENEVMCPVCKTPLGLAQEAPQADRQRAFILERIEHCETKGEIKAALAREFGDEVLAMPERRGFDLAAYIVPAVALALAVAAGTLAIVRWRRRRPAASALPKSPPGGATGGSGATAAEGDDVATTPGPTPSAAARLERDLERYDT